MSCDFVSDDERRLCDELQRVDKVKDELREKRSQVNELEVSVKVHSKVHQYFIHSYYTLATPINILSRIYNYIQLN